MALTDHTSDVEIKLLDFITGQEACSMVCDKLVACLPSKRKAKGAEQAMQDVERLLASDNHRLAPAAAQWLSAIVEGRALAESAPKKGSRMRMRPRSLALQMFKGKKS